MNLENKIVLASASPRRRELLSQIGINPRIIPSQVEETITAHQPDEAVMELSRQKAEDVAFSQKPGVLVIGADTVVACQGKILGKPKSHEEACQMISMLQGRNHQVYTGVTLIYCVEKRKKTVTFAEKTEVFVSPMTQEEIWEYGWSSEPMDKAGAYGIQGRFKAFIERIEGDYNNVVGLPVCRVYHEIKKMMEEE